jgi:hypothetical protein
VRLYDTWQGKVAFVTTWQVIGLFLVGCVLAFPLAILISAFLGWLLKIIGTKCPKCQRRTLELWWSVLSNPRPSPMFYKCANCGARYMTGDRGWEDASSPEFDEKYEPNVFGSMRPRE